MHAHTFRTSPLAGIALLLGLALLILAPAPAHALPEYSLWELNLTPDPFVGTPVSSDSLVVTRVVSNGFFCQEPDTLAAPAGTNWFHRTRREFSGMFVFTGSAPANFGITGSGDLVSVTGTFTIFNGWNEVVSPGLSIVRHGSITPLPATPASLAEVSLPSPAMRGWIGVFVRISMDEGTLHAVPSISVPTLLWTVYDRFGASLDVSRQVWNPGASVPQLWDWVAFVQGPLRFQFNAPNIVPGGPEDIGYDVAPDLVAAWSTGATGVDVLLSRNVTTASATNLANWSFPGSSLGVLSAAIVASGEQNRVHLTTSTQPDGALESLRANGLVTLFGSGAEGPAMPSPQTVGFRAGLTPVSQVQTVADPASDDASPLAGQLVTIRGRVTSGSATNPDSTFWLQQGAGAWCGLHVSAPWRYAQSGDSVEVVGRVREHAGQTELADPGFVVFHVLASGLPPVVTTVPSLRHDDPATSEPWEGQLVRLANVTADSSRGGTARGEWSLVVAPGDTAAMDVLTHGDTPNATQEFCPGDVLDATGPLAFTDGLYRIQPRSTADIVVSAPSHACGAPGFTALAAGLPGLVDGALDWGDFDGDGDLDLVVSGSSTGGVQTRILRNDGGAFTDIGAGLPGTCVGAVSWGDYDGDGDLDLALTGAVNVTRDAGMSAIYRNDGGVFTDIAAGLAEERYSALAWGDCDGDGDLDLVLAGYDGASIATHLYRNGGHGSFTEVPSGLPGVTNDAALAWADVDQDGDLDLVLAGYTGSSAIAQVWLNDGAGTFAFHDAGLPGVYDRTALALADYDGDGAVDLALSGSSDLGPQGGIYRGTGNAGFMGPLAGTQGLAGDGAAWGDYDNDGDLDLVVTGATADGTPATRLYRNHAGAFDEVAAGLPDVRGGDVAWADLDGDGDLDLALAGYGPYGLQTVLLRGDGAPARTAPGAPAGAIAARDGDEVTFSWAPPDDGSAARNLTYNLRVGITPGGGQLVSAMADSVTGRRRVARAGNHAARYMRTMHLPMGTRYYWAVQAVDGGFAGSTFATSSVPTTAVEGEALPRAFALRSAGPNPFSQGTRVQFDLPSAVDVSLDVLDVAGRHVRSLRHGVQPAGRHLLVWDGRDERGRSADAGVYYLRLRTPRLTRACPIVRLH